MTEARAVRCDGCGGTVQLRPDQPALSRCLFCGEPAEHLRPAVLAATDLAPTSRAPALLDPDAVKERFRSWRRTFSMAPFAISSAAVQVQLVYVPAVRFSGDLETHWFGKRRVRTNPSGVEPAAGVERERVTDAFVVASHALKGFELRALGTFGEVFEPLGPSATADAVEVAALTERGLRQKGRVELADRHKKLLLARHGLATVEVSSFDHSLESEVVLLPVWIGAYPLRGRPWRWLANGVTGAVVGTAPWSRVKVGFPLALLCSVATLTPLPLLAWLAFVVAWKLGWVDD
jgi:hypothetical protein